jgi:endonuclease/exonuclease/phosphatase family metal-dependent hydrolase
VTTGRRDRGRWEDHLRYLASLEKVLQSTDKATVLIGDFNQAIPKRTAPDQAFEALSAAVLRRLVVPTAGEIAPLALYAIDHVAHTPDLLSELVSGLSPVGPTGEKLSDHFGLAVKLRPSSEGLSQGATLRRC